MKKILLPIIIVLAATAFFSVFIVFNNFMGTYLSLFIHGDNRGNNIGTLSIYVLYSFPNISINIISDGREILNTGGGIKNMMSKSDEKNFFVFNSEIFDFIKGDKTMLEREPLEKLAKIGELVAFKHHGFWQCMDTIRDKILLNKLWKKGVAPWKK